LARSQLPLWCSKEEPRPPPGLSLENAATYAATGVDYLAVGALTHSVRALDIGLDM